MKKKKLIRFLLLTALPLCIIAGTIRFGMTFELPKTKYLLPVNASLIEINDGMNLSRLWLEGARINRQGGVLENINFSNSYLVNADLRETVFRNCSFKGANLSGVNALDAGFVDCDFEDAIIEGAKINLNQEQLRSTRSYKERSLRNVETQIRDFSGWDFSGFNLGGCTLMGDLTDCDFTDAQISGSVVYRRTLLAPSFSKEQLMSTRSFKHKMLMNLEFRGWPLNVPEANFAELSPEADFTELDLSGFFMHSVRFERDVKGINLTDAVISTCNFWYSKNLTLDQVKSTWNYKTGNMMGGGLPKEIREQLDAERQPKEESP